MDASLTKSRSQSSSESHSHRCAAPDEFRSSSVRHARAQREAESAVGVVAHLPNAVPAAEVTQEVSSLVWIGRAEVAGVFCLQIVEDRVAKLLPLDLLYPLAPVQDHGADGEAEGHDAQDDRGGQGSRRQTGGWGRGVSPVGPLKGRSHRELTARAHEPRGALTDGSAEVGVARAPVLALVHQARVGAGAAVLTRVAQRASAHIIVDAIDARASVLAGHLGAVVHIDVAVGSGEAWTTPTEDTLTQIHAFTPCKKRSIK